MMASKPPNNPKGGYYYYAYTFPHKKPRLREMNSPKAKAERAEFDELVS